jgi:hypothetical protein
MFPLEMITWEDHYSHQGWQDIPMESPEYLATTVGWVVYEDKKKVVLAQSIADNAIADAMHIMKVNIRHRDDVEIVTKPSKKPRNSGKKEQLK